MNQTVHDFINKLRAIEEADSGEVPVPAATSGATNIDAYKPKDNIPEMDIKDDNLEFIFGVGGENKQNSSSWILNSWKNKN